MKNWDIVLRKRVKLKRDSRTIQENLDDYVRRESLTYKLKKKWICLTR